MRRAEAHARAAFEAALPGQVSPRKIFVDMVDSTPRN